MQKHILGECALCSERTKDLMKNPTKCNMFNSCTYHYMYTGMHTHAGTPHPTNNGTINAHTEKWIAKNVYKSFRRNWELNCIDSLKLARILVWLAKALIQCCVHTHAKRINSPPFMCVCVCMAHSNLTTTWRLIFLFYVRNVRTFCIHSSFRVSGQLKTSTITSTSTRHNLPTPVLFANSVHSRCLCESPNFIFPPLSKTHTFCLSIMEIFYLFPYQLGRCLHISFWFNANSHIAVFIYATVCDDLISFIWKNSREKITK